MNDPQGYYAKKVLQKTTHMNRGTMWVDMGWNESSHNGHEENVLRLLTVMMYNLVHLLKMKTYECYGLYNIL